MHYYKELIGTRGCGFTFNHIWEIFRHDSISMAAVLKSCCPFLQQTTEKKTKAYPTLPQWIIHKHDIIDEKLKLEPSDLI